eukprot:TRINITY_DN3851_c0_g1_i1.p1 TRINITY_DN3851_c0_g1~~TRINITY_DN3851_c0_g1_i1.p1  ORF type:complete len:311 (+),score=48.74 TRINITY_DN3851_c0_g1_i1:116-1048(+)
MSRPPQTGKSVGKYKLQEVLGEGSFGKVHRAICTETKKEYAVKCIAKESLAKQEHGKEQLYREIAIMKSLKHKHVVDLCEVLQTSNNIYLVMELVDGGELFRKIRPDGGMQEEIARRYFQQLICAMHYCHNQQVAHRDLKPENFLLTKGDLLKVSDFGLSNLQFVNEGGTVSNSLKLRTVCGTPNYVAPEVITTAGGYNGFRADVWSCGVILYHLLAGFLPFRASSVQALLKKIKTSDPEDCPGISMEAKDLLKRLLEKDPQKRINLSDVLIHPWFVVGFDAKELEDAEKVVVTEEQISMLGQALNGLGK